MPSIFSKPGHDPYSVLNVDRRASAAEIKKAYFRMVRQHPPEQEPEKFQEIRAAYEQLRSSATRAKADLFLLQPPPELPNRRRPAYDLSVHVEDVLTLALEWSLVQHPPQEDFRDPEFPGED